ncbi:MAG: hypothetical protein GXZ02_04780 [Clostridiales bacterium]|nr:hypothetical protein [Clostridiales bacterium]
MLALTGSVTLDTCTIENALCNEIETTTETETTTEIETTTDVETTTAAETTTVADNATEAETTTEAEAITQTKTTPETAATTTQADVILPPTGGENGKLIALAVSMGLIFTGVAYAARRKKNLI